MIKVAILCAQRRGVYQQIEGVEVYDELRNAWTFKGGIPVVAHPPCRQWSKFCSRLAKQAPGEKELGLFCVQQVKEWGGVLEQPAYSMLFDAGGLPLPGSKDMDGGWTVEVWQAWWGYPMKKSTWLYFSKINRKYVEYPFRLHGQGRDRRTFQLMSRAQRSRTTIQFAQWLVGNARRVYG